MSRRVAITGMGLVSPLGNFVDEAWARLLNGESGIARISRFDASAFATQIAGEVRNFSAENWVEPREAPFMSEFIAYARAAAQMALDESGLLETILDRTRVGVNVGSAVGGMELISRQTLVLQQKTPRHIPALFVPFCLPDAASNSISIHHGLGGPNHINVSSCATGANCIGEAMRLIQSGRAVAMIAGGAESAICPLTLAGFTSMRAVSTRNDAPAQASRPFDAARDGFVLGEGAAVLVLEDWEYAKARGARVVAEIVGYGTTADAHHITQPQPDGAGAVRCMNEAFVDAGIEAAQIGYINAHGTSTLANDRTETAAIKQIWKASSMSVPMSSTKSMTGHLLGAAGALEAIFCALALRDGILPPTINLETPDPQCDLDYVPNVARRASPEYALSNSFGFGGHNASLVFKRAG